MPRYIYTQEQLDFIADAYRRMRLQDVAEAYNARFGEQRTLSAMRSVVRRNHNMRCGRSGSERFSRPAWTYTPEVLQYLRENYATTTQPELRVELKARFGLDLTRVALNQALKRYGISCDRTGQFVAGGASWNKGKTGYMGANKTSFKKGNLPWTARPLYSESVGKDGYVFIIVPERNPWTGAATRRKHKHLWLWEQANGPLPPKHAVIFADGDICNFAPENLLCVSRNLLLILNLHDYKNQPAELKPSIMALAKLEAEGGVRTIKPRQDNKRKR